MENISRRDFIVTTAVATGAFLGRAKLGAADAATKAPSSPGLVLLGKTGIKVSRLAIGTGTVGFNKHSHQTRLGQKKFTELMRHAYERGIRFFDLADQYGSHPFFAQAMKDGIPREKIVISTKIWVGSSKEEDVKGALDRFRKELGTDYIDMVHLHCMMDDAWPQRLKKWMDGLEDAKHRKVIRAHGVTCHSLGALKAAATTPWVDYMQPRINHLGKRMDASPDVVVPVLKQAHASGKGIGGMKILAEGDISDQREESLKFVLGLDCVDTLVIGFENKEEIDDVVQKMASVLKQPAG